MLRTRPNSSSISSTTKNDGCLNKNIESAIARHAKIMAEIEMKSRVLFI
jgi:hypothetical protein